MLNGQSMPEVLQEALRLANARRRGGGEGLPFSILAFSPMACRHGKLVLPGQQQPQ